LLWSTCWWRRPYGTGEDRNGNRCFQAPPGVSVAPALRDRRGSQRQLIGRHLLIVGRWRRPYGTGEDRNPSAPGLSGQTAQSGAGPTGPARIATRCRARPSATRIPCGAGPTGPARIATSPGRRTHPWRHRGAGPTGPARIATALTRRELERLAGGAGPTGPARIATYTGTS